MGSFRHPPLGYLGACQLPHEVNPPRLIGHDRNAPGSIERNVPGQASRLERPDACEGVRVDHGDPAGGAQARVHDALVGRQSHLVDGSVECSSHDLSGGQVHQIEPSVFVAALEAQAIG